MRQWLRKCRLSAKGDSGELKINHGSGPHDLKIAFSISKDISSTQNDATIEIWNLAEGHRNAIGKELDEITLEAGYQPPDGGGNVGVIFKGQMRDVEHRRDGNDIVTKLTCGEGDKAFRRATISKTFKKGTKVSEVVEDIYTQLEKEGITRGEMKFPEKDREFKRPYSMCGSCKREIDRLGRSEGFYWSVQNGTFELVPSDGFLNGEVVLSPDTGLIDTPTITDNGVKVACLLNPEIRVGRRIKVVSQVLEMNAEDGAYRVSQLTLNGDNRDGTFRCDIQAESVKDKKVDEGRK